MRQLSLGTVDVGGPQDISCFGAICSIPDLGLESEEVVISVDAVGDLAPMISVGLDGSRQMLLQSLTRPDLGLTVLHLDSHGQLTGGDESWTPGTAPIIRSLAKSGRHAKLTALMAASARGRTEVALMHAIHGQRIDVCQLLLDNKAEFQHVQSSRHLRVIKPQGPALAMLVTVLAEGGSPLILAASGARYELCKMLVEKKARKGMG
eukprot:Skav223444  [mRNA]  locus=scaffold350:727023:732753:+ [translate_table: standard]